MARADKSGRRALRPPPVFFRTRRREACGSDRRIGRRVLPRDLLKQTHYLAGIAVLVIVPDIERAALPRDDRGVRVDDRGVRVADEIARDDIIRRRELDLLLELGVDRHLSEMLVQLLDARLFSEVQRKHGERDVRGRNPDRVPGELAFELGEGLRDCARGARLRDDHIDRGCAPSAMLLMEVIDEVLVVRISVDRLHMTALDAEGIVHGLKDGDDRIRRAARGREDLLVGIDLMMVHAVDDIRDIAFTGGREGHLLYALGRDMLRETLSIAVDARIIDDDRVLDLVFGVIDLFGGGGSDELNIVAVDDERVLFLKDLDRAEELAVDGVVLKEARALLQIARGAGADDDGAEPAALAATCFIDEDARHQPPNTAKTVKHDVLGLAPIRAILSGDIGEDLLGIILEASGASLSAIMPDEAR